MRGRSWTGAIVAAALVVVACGSGSGGSPGTTANPTGTGGASGATASAGGQGPAGSAGGSQANGTVKGSITTGAPYPATWTWQPGNAVTDGITLNSDKGTFANLDVTADGAVTFTSGAPELSAAQPYQGTGALVDILTIGGFPNICKIQLDTDLTGSGGATIHLKGTLELEGAFYSEGSAVTGVPSIDCR